MLNPSITQKYKIDTLLSLGCKQWQKGSMNRIYLPEPVLHQLLDLKVTYYNTGNIGSIEQGGEVLSNSQGSKVLSSLTYCKFYYDVTSDSYGYKHSQGYVDLHSIVFRKLDEYIQSKYDTQRAVVAEREVTIDELNAALGF
ncbi:hypothetical protein [Clostridium beijerinckii]|uniref:Uncharacterized protein n=1 Tax=Clostridium beijerinckii TaxID=1520 RepID=A0AAW3W5I7_CLOBE|nr:hypothetical protein [Clostridium beijerinckii]MBC2457144.1 hypothetical protein [Clostridium beijerinckii]MBC2474201.1 hypothetical protein [Clostridium beijerinckii]NOV58700.1 hypothetical protein [Clostridium beijerinckii]NOV71915.1 hypothetical protein [Clostridium beijerinckii]NOW32055.1 hypothetical protein [Clostridium beijerinckii]